MVGEPNGTNGKGGKLTAQDKREIHNEVVAPRVSDAEGRIDGAESTLSNHATRLGTLEAFMNRSEGFAAFRHDNNSHIVPFALQDHTHSGAAITSGTVAAARIGSHDNNNHLVNYAVDGHNHSGAAITSGKVDAARLGSHDNNQHLVPFAVQGHTHSVPFRALPEEAQEYVLGLRERVRAGEGNGELKALLLALTSMLVDHPDREGAVGDKGPEPEATAELPDLRGEK